MSDVKSKISRLNVFASILLVFLGLFLTMAVHSLNPFIFLCGSVLFFDLLHGSTVSVINYYNGNRVKQQAETPFIGLHINIVTISVCFFLIGMVSMVERLLWTHSDSMPALFVAHDYGDRYTANKHRMLKSTCESKNEHYFFEIKETSPSKVLVRCGQWYPQNYVISVNKELFFKAQSETSKDEPNTPFLVEQD